MTVTEFQATLQVFPYLANQSAYVLVIFRMRELVFLLISLSEPWRSQLCIVGTQKDRRINGLCFFWLDSTTARVVGQCPSLLIHVVRDDNCSRVSEWNPL
jgi:hypothetical protein